ncbi:MAG: class I SAM-dependent DNA methyltransferase [Minwuia sp.]|uniref:class I SAM-dependent DNA methyltransferase n=1 Tax=Minwuia sp. TaxID=2493630 RepID=UPI003A8679E9
MPDRDAILKQVYQAAGDTKKLSESYNQWAESYDADLAAMGYRYPFMITGTLGRYVARLDAEILDAGCGSGMIGEALYLVGYRNLSGIDISDGMLTRAAEKGVYKDLRRGVLGETLPYGDSSFDAVVSSGVMTIGHAPPECLLELARVVKSDGYFVFTIVKESWAGGYRDVAERLFAERVMTPVYNTRRFVVLPGARAEDRTEARVHVMKKL